MLKIDKIQQIEDVTIYGDDSNYYTFYPVPQSPRFRLENGKPSFKFVKYRELRKDGDDLFGGVCAFDTEFVVEPEKLESIKRKLQTQVDEQYRKIQNNRRDNEQSPPVVIFAPLTYTGGTVNLNISDGGTLVEAVHGAGKPSLFGNNVATFWVELTKAGATVFEAAMKGEGGFISIVYDMTIMAKLPPITARAWFKSKQFYSYLQDASSSRYTHIRKSGPFWNRKTTTTRYNTFKEEFNEYMRKKEAMGTEFNFVGDPSLSGEERIKIEESIRNTLQRQLDDAVQRNLLTEIERFVPDPKERERVVSGDVHSFKEMLSKTQIVDVEIKFTENRVIEWNIAPQGLLPNITTMKDPDGNFFKWEDYFVEVDLGDVFFRTLDILVRVNADFADLPIYNVEVKLSYPHGSNKPVEEFAFTKPDDVSRFRAFVDTISGIRNYNYVYQVNYRGDSRVFTSQEFETDDTQLTINVDDLGILAVDIAPGDINFAQVKQAQIIVRYEDADIKPIERQFIMTPETSIFQIREVIFKERVRPIQYSVKYFMLDGREYETNGRQQDAPQLYINDPFSATKTVGLRAIGDLDTKIQTIMVDLVYKDAANNNYTQTQSVAISKEAPFFDWTFPVIDENAGELKYSATISYRNGTTQDIPETIANRSTIQIGDVVADRLEVTVLPDLIDFGAVRLITVALHYVDASGNVDERKTMSFKPGDPEQHWIVDIKNKAVRDFTWSAVFYMADGGQKKIDNKLEQGGAVVLELPTSQP